MFDYENRIIGILFQYYRKKKKLSIQKLISYKSDAVKILCETCKKKCKNRSAVISHKTIERINKGQVSKRNCLYVDLANKLGFKYEVYQYLSNRIDTYANEVLALIRSKNKAELNNLKVKLTMFLKQVSTHIYYSEITKIFISIIDLELLDYYCEKTVIEIMEEIYPYLNLNYKKIFIYYFYRYYYNSRNINKYNYYLQEAKLYYPENIQISLMREGAEKNPYDLLNELLNKDNSYINGDQFFYYQYIAFLYLNLDKIQSGIKYLDRCIKLANECNMSDYYLYQSYMRKGLALYRSCDYQGTIDSFKYVYVHDLNVMMLNLIIFFDCFKKLDIEYLSKKYFADIYFSKINNKMNNAIFNYYKLKYITKANESDLEDYIVNILKPYLSKGLIYEKIILTDLTKYTEKTRHYYKLHQFMTDTKKK